MAVAVTSQTLHDGRRNVVMQLTGLSDGDGQETDVVKVDVSELTPRPETVRVHKIDYAVDGGVVILAWAADTPVTFAVLTGQSTIDHSAMGGLVNNADDSRTGDILLSTKGFELDSSYTITLHMVKKH